MAAQQQHVKALYFLAHHMQEGTGMEGGEAEAVKCYRILADMGEPIAMTRLGMLLEAGQAGGAGWGRGEAVRLCKAAIAPAG